MLPASSCSTNVRVPCSTPVLPPAKRAAWRPGAIRSPPASTPISRTPASSMKPSKMPMALLPPPTQATTTSGSRPACVEHLPPRLAADHRLELAHHQRVRMRPERRAEQVVGVGDVGDPVAHRLVDRVLERPAAGVHLPHRGAEQLHAHDVQRLAAHVLGAHVDDALEAEQRAGGGRRDAVLPGAGLGDDAASCPCAGPAAPARARC